MSKHSRPKKSIFEKLTSRRILLSLQLLASTAFVFFTYSLKIFPLKYFTTIIIANLVIWFLMFIWMKSGHMKKKRENRGVRLILSKFVSISISIALIIASSYFVRGNNFLDIISNAFQETHVVSVYALESNKAIQKVEDIAGKDVGVSYKEGTTFISKGVLELEKELNDNVNLVESDDYANLGAALYEGKVDCIMIDEAYIPILEEHYPDFESVAKVITTYKLVQDIKVSTTETDVTKNPFVMYITGIDAYGDVSTVSRTDVNIVLVVNPVEKQILMISIPRDTQVTLASYNKMDKLTHSAMYGINETIETLEGFLDVEFNYYAKTNFTGIIDIIDQLGGVEIDSPHEFTTLHGNYHIKKGLNQMDGEKALCFVRERYDLPNGDLDRGKNQQLLLKAMLKKAMSSKIITNYNSLLSAIEGSFETNMSSDSIRSLINMQLDDMSGWDIFNMQVTGEFVKSSKTYSMPGQSIETIVPDAGLTKKIIEVINKVERGEKISQQDVQGLE